MGVLAGRGGRRASVVRGWRCFRKWSARSEVFFSVGGQLGIPLARLLPGLGFGLPGPVGEHFLPELLDLLNGAGLRFIGSAALGDRVIDHVRDIDETLAEMRAIGKKVVETLL